jgi:hypothetical protein
MVKWKNIYSSITLKEGEHTLRKSETLSVTIQTSFDKAWTFIVNPENLHLWTIDFALSSPKKAGGIYQVETPRGLIELFVKLNRDAGTIDFYFGRDGRYGCSPSRLFPNDEEVLYIFTQFEPDHAPPGLFEKLVSNVRKELQILKERLES